MDALVESAALADDLERGHRYNAACCAARAASRGESDAAPWRERALEWLRADLEALSSRADLSARLRHWKLDPDLAHVRDHLDDLSAAEREGWANFWADVDTRIADSSAR